MMDGAEAITNAVAGLVVSWALVLILRASGAWDAAAPVVVAAFFVASVARSYAIRRAFRWLQS